MKYKLKLLLIFVIINIMLNNCGRKEKGRFYSDEYGFSIIFPKYWEIQQKEMGTVVIALSPEEGSMDSFRENIAITVENIEENISLDKYFELSNTNLKSYSKDYKVLYKNYTWVSGKRAIILGFTYTMSGLKLKVLQYYCIYKQRAYVITCTALPQTFDRYEERFLRAIRSFRFEKK